MLFRLSTPYRTKVDQLMALCDDLESKLKQSQTDGEKLMEAVVHQLVAT